MELSQLPSLYTLFLIFLGLAFLVSIWHYFDSKDFKPTIAIFFCLSLAIFANHYMFTIKTGIDAKQAEIVNIRVNQMNMTPTQKCEVDWYNPYTYHCIYEVQANALVNSFMGILADGTQSFVRFATDDYLFQIRTDNLVKIFDKGIFYSALFVGILIYGACYSHSLIRLLIGAIMGKELHLLPARLKQKTVDLIFAFPMMILMPLFNLAIIISFAQINSLVQADKFSQNFYNSFKLSGVSNLVGIELVVYLCLVITFLILAVTHMIWQVGITVNTLKSLWAVAVSPLAEDGYEVPLKDTISSCLAIIVSKYTILIAFTMVSENMISSLIILIIGMWICIKQRSYFEQLFRNSMLNMDLAVISQAVRQGIRHLSAKSQVGETIVPNPPSESSSSSASESFSAETGDQISYSHSNSSSQSQSYRTVPIMKSNFAKYISKLRGK